MARQAKCAPCGLRYVWAKSHPLNGAYCPECGAKLVQTNIMSRLPISRISPLDRRSAARLSDTANSQEGK